METQANSEAVEKEAKPLKIAGYSYLLGDAAMFAAAAARHGKDSANLGKLFGSAAWFAGGVAAARYGNPDKETQLQLLGQRLEKHLKSEGIIIPEDIRAQNTLLRDKTFWEKTELFLHQHPSEMLNLSYAIGAVGALRDGIKDIKNSGKTIFPTRGVANISNSFWVGALVLAGAVGGLLIKENPAAVQEAQNGSLLDKTKAYFQEKPLRWSGLLYGINNIPLANLAYQDFKGREGIYSSKTFKPHLFSITQVASYVFANVMLSLSSRNQVSDTKFNSDAVMQIEDAAARIIAAQSPDVQQQALVNVSHFIAKQNGVTLSPEQLAQDMVNRIQLLTQNRLSHAVEQTKVPESKADFAAKERMRRQMAETEAATSHGVGV